MGPIIVSFWCMSLLFKILSRRIGLCSSRTTPSAKTTKTQWIRNTSKLRTSFSKLRGRTSLYIRNSRLKSQKTKSWWLTLSKWWIWLRKHKLRKSSYLKRSRTKSVTVRSKVNKDWTLERVKRRLLMRRFSHCLQRPKNLTQNWEILS